MDFSPSKEEIKDCAKCGVSYDPKEPDPCIGFIPGASHACCGHDEPEFAYVVLGGEPNQTVNTTCEDGHPFLILRAERALDFFDSVRHTKTTPARFPQLRGCGDLR